MNYLAHVIMNEFTGNVGPKRHFGPCKQDRMIIPIQCQLIESNETEYTRYGFTVDILLMKMYPQGRGSVAVLSRARKRLGYRDEIPDEIYDTPWLHLSHHESCWRDGVTTICNSIRDMMVVPEMWDDDKWYIMKPDDKYGEKLRQDIRSHRQSEIIPYNPANPVRRFEHDEFINMWIKERIKPDAHY